jgi:hypothetical protein
MLNVFQSFLTPSFEAAKGIKPLAALGVHAQSLHSLNFLIAEPISVAIPYRSGVLVQVPRPERFAIHKLIIADRPKDGPDSLKSRKDRAQAAYLIGILAEDRPDDLAEAFEDAVSRGARWQERLAGSLGKMPDHARVARFCRGEEAGRSSSVVPKAPTLSGEASPKSPIACSSGNSVEKRLALGSTHRRNEPPPAKWRHLL